MRKRIFFTNFVFAILLVIISACGGDKSSRPNIILCMADDLGWGDVGYNGHPYIKTPSLDKMARDGIRFDRFYSGSSVCSPTRGSCLTGRNPFRYGVKTANMGHLRKEEVNLAEVMKKLGYATGHFGKWHLGTLSPDFSGKGPGRKPEENYMTPGMAGFDEWFSTEFAVSTYEPYSKETAHTKAWSEEGDWRALYWHNGTPLSQELEGCDSKIIMDRAIPFIESSVKEETPFFTVIWFHAPHAPVVGHPKYMEELYSDRPENEQHFFSVVTAVDTQMGRLREKLRDLGVEDNTLLCFTSDNGPEGNPGKKGRHQGTAGDFRGRKRSLYEGGIRVPGIIEFPSRFEGGKVITAPCGTSDYFPTIIDLLGYELKDTDRPYDGISMLPFLENGNSLRNKAIGFQWGKQRAWTSDRYKLVQNLSEKRHKSDNGSVPVEEFELYDLIDDPGETKNIASMHPDILSKMKEELAAFVISCESSLAGADYLGLAE